MTSPTLTPLEERTGRPAIPRPAKPSPEERLEIAEARIGRLWAQGDKLKRQGEERDQVTSAQGWLIVRTWLAIGAVGGLAALGFGLSLGLWWVG